MDKVILQEHELFRLVITLAILFLFLSLIIIGIILAYGKRRQKHLLEVKELEHNYQQSLLSSQIEIQEQTLRNISQELHDNISQQLGLVKIQLTQLETETPSVAQSKTVVTQTIEDIRAMSKSLHPDRIASISLKDNILHELERLRKLSGLNICGTIAEDPSNLSVETRIILFRIFQELLNNVLKHAEATQIDVTLEYPTGALSLSVADNGKGLPAGFSEGIGFTSMKNRLVFLEGSFELPETHQTGTNVKVTIPLK